MTLRRLLRILFIVPALIFAAGCASKKQPSKPAAPVVIGKVSLVNTELEFILIDTYYTPPAGTPLRAVNLSGDDSALLTVSQEKRRPFIIANIDEGTPQVGDRVIMEPKYIEETTTTTTESEVLIEPAANLRQTTTP